MSTLKQLYPSSNTVALTLTLASLASDTTLLAGRASTVVDNTTNLDLDALLSGVIRVSATAPTLSAVIEIWAYAPTTVISGTKAYPDGITGTDAAKTMTSLNVKQAGLVLVQSITMDATGSRDYFLKKTSIASLFGGMPDFWGIFVTNGSGQSLNATQVGLHYQRCSAQSV